jgi:iron complex transport system permease protein
MPLNHRLAYLAAAVFLIAAALVSALVGAADLNPLATVAALADKIPFIHLPSGLGPLEAAVLFDIRLPRIVLGAMVGALLAVAGAAYQGVFHNPLVDSGMLGASAGAGLGATLALIYLTGAGPSAVPVAAFAGSLAGVAISYLAGAVGAARGAVGRGTATLLLAGVAVGLFLTAVQTFILQRSTQDTQRIYAWLLGSLSGATWQQVTEILPYAVIGTAVILLHGKHLDVLSVGDEEARTLGMHPQAVRGIVVASAALAAASAVAVSGLIGFVGIIVPHVVRRLAGTSYRLVLPLSLLTGAGFFVLADTAARTLLAPAEVPIGVVTALAGSPAFVWILRGTRAVDT